MEDYLRSCSTQFWKSVFEAERDYIRHRLEGARDILSVGCGPAIIEANLAEDGFNVTGLDISEEALGHAPEGVRTIAGSADKTDFADSSFDAVVYVASLQFIEGYRQAIKETARVLRTGGKVLIMLLNPNSAFYKEKAKDPHSYINKIKHEDLKEIEEAVGKHFSIGTEYFLGIDRTRVFHSEDPELASLYVINGVFKACDAANKYVGNR